MFGKAFGKRVVENSTTVATHNSTPTRPDPDDEARLLPKAIWDGPKGDMLRELGFFPDGQSNMLLTPERARIMEDEATERMNGIVAKVEAHVTGLAVRPWAIIPWVVWQGLNAEFLMKADYYPSSPWNNLLLPIDARSSDYLELPLHPQAALPGLDENLTRLITELRLECQVDIDRFMVAFSRGDISFLDEFEEHRNNKFQKLFALTRYVATEVLGQEAIARHDELFGMGLSGVTD